MLKREARKGQCFSTTSYVDRLQPSDIDQGALFPDVERNGFCFTDGSGFVDDELANQIDASKGYKSCSAYQIRIAGAKGVIARLPDLKKETGKKICLRPS